MDKGLYESIDRGILFEDNGRFLKWNKSIYKLSKENLVEKNRKTDRTIYYWGKHKILGGLELDLFSFYWNYNIRSIYKKFSSIEFKVIGDEISEEYFSLIRNPIEGQFGKGKESLVSNSDKSIEWNINGVTLYLYLFEQFVYKLVFKVSRD